jgi:transaldolase
MTVEPLGQVRIFADGADVVGVKELRRNPIIAGFTTNPTLMRQAGVLDYETFGRDLLDAVDGLSVSFEVLSDDFREMERQARKLASWGPNVYVKIPITNTRAANSAPTIRALTESGVKVNVTAIMTEAQVGVAIENLAGGPGGYVSVFAGRVADTGRDPVPMMRAAVAHLEAHDEIDLIWASPREILNIVQAGAIGCDIITVTHDLLKKLPVMGRDLDEYSLDTVKMFVDDATAAGLSI